MDVFTALAEPTRRNIIEMLAANGQLSATDISDRFHTSPPAISQHLKVLREANLVEMEKRAQQRIYKINPASLKQLEEWARRMGTMWEERFRRLDKILAEEKSLKKGGLTPLDNLNVSNGVKKNGR
ncbi:MAG: metalloregulator ArsR/SmtB family transcription factor [Candidatus Curtissbacteria bacterium]|nr:metalloregulator ArsR/SmtB family transcription factor [Candidatus Curtissbacteria bacterium]